METPHLIVIKDKNPKAITHFLIIPKKHIDNLKTIGPTDGPLAQELLFTAQKLGQQLSGSGDFSLIMHNGRKACQTVFHMHLHFMSPEMWHYRGDQ